MNKSLLPEAQPRTPQCSQSDPTGTCRRLLAGDGGSETLFLWRLPIVPVALHKPPQEHSPCSAGPAALMGFTSYSARGSCPLCQRHRHDTRDTTSSPSFPQPPGWRRRCWGLDLPVEKLFARPERAARCSCPSRRCSSRGRHRDRCHPEHVPRPRSDPRGSSSPVRTSRSGGAERQLPLSGEILSRARLTHSQRPRAAPARPGVPRQPNPRLFPAFQTKERSSHRIIVS